MRKQINILKYRPQNSLQQLKNNPQQKQNIDVFNLKKLSHNLINEKQNQDKQGLILIESSGKKLYQTKIGNILGKFLKKDNHVEQLKLNYTQYFTKNYIVDEINLIRSKSNINIKQNFLSNHQQITPQLRQKMVDWMIEVLCTYKMSEQAFFKSVNIMDTYFHQQINKQQQARQLHILGVASMFIACKYQDISPIKMSQFKQKICRNKFTQKQLLSKQDQILLILNFKIPTHDHIYDSINNILQILFIRQKLKNQQNIKYFNKILLYLAKMCMINYDLAQKNFVKLSVAIVFVGLKIIQQTQEEIEPENKLNVICEILELSQQGIKDVIQIGKKVLKMAQNFSRDYAHLKNLAKFHNFNNKKQNQ